MKEKVDQLEVLFQVQVFDLETSEPSDYRAVNLSVIDQGKGEIVALFCACLEVNQVS